MDPEAAVVVCKQRLILPAWVLRVEATDKYLIEYWAGFHALSDAVYDAGFCTMEPAEAFPLRKNIRQSATAARRPSNICISYLSENSELGGRTSDCHANNLTANANF